MEKRLKILVLTGGLSEEREISLASAGAVTEALIRLGYDVKAIDTSSGKSLLDSKGRYLLEEDTISKSKIAFKKTDSLVLAESIRSDQYHDSDLAFIVLHGGSGEDGTIQALLDLAGIKYTGSGMLASALAMNKAMTKRLVRNENIPTPGWLFFKTGGDINLDKYAENIKREFSFPLIVKPNNSGSTVGLTLVREETELLFALESASEVSNEILIEKYIKGREITVAVLNEVSLPLVEIVPSNELYDYQCKYTSGKSEYICPAQLPVDIAEEISNFGQQVYRIIGCSGLARVDFILDKQNRPFFLEINTIPGMMELSLAPMAAKEAGIDFDGLIEQICRISLEK